MDPDAEVFARMRNLLAYPDTKFTGNGDEILRQITARDTLVSRPNVIMITIESFSADFMKRFGNTQGITPVLDSLAKQSVLFTNMYATGTRTVRGMEALTLAVPPTPGSSIVRRNDNEGLFTVGSIFKDAGYKRTFFYGGDGYFDNMNKFFSGNGFDIVDHPNTTVVNDNLVTTRTAITKKDIQFENAWGICDEDIYKAVIRDADEDYRQGKKFFNFVMTTSNHRPYTYPANKISIPEGSREGAVRYTDYAIGKLLEEARTKPWFANTVFIFVADHCASSAGKNEINVSKYHIPCLVYNLPNTKPVELSPVCSQIDLYPTVFNYLNWSYKSNLFGENINAAQYQPRALVGTYQKLGYLKNDTLIVLGPQQKADCYSYKQQTDEQKQAPMNNHLLHEAIANYQSAYQLYKNGGMRENQLGIKN
jgi:phosphoglycerol transferase MdoB-like AlkP superfamily enzyme